MRHLIAVLSLAAVSGAAVCGPAAAHDFWLQPTRFNLAAKAATPMIILVGHGPFRTRWSGAVDRVMLFQSPGPDGVKDLKGLLRPTPDKDADLSFAAPGDYVVAFQSNYADSTLPSIAMHLSDAAGRASFAVPRTGTWLINVIWTKPIKGNPKADFDTTFSSLTFGYGGQATR